MTTSCTLTTCSCAVSGGAHGDKETTEKKNKGRGNIPQWERKKTEKKAEKGGESTIHGQKKKTEQANDLEFDGRNGGGGGER